VSSAHGVEASEAAHHTGAGHDQRLSLCHWTATALSANLWVMVDGGASDAPRVNVAAGTAQHRVRLPRFLVNEPVGLGQVVKRATMMAGAKPCSPCEQRAARLDRWMLFEPRR
jgi:hypothetical protein